MGVTVKISRILSFLKIMSSNELDIQFKNYNI